MYISGNIKTCSFVEVRTPAYISSTLRYTVEAPEINDDADDMLISEMTSLATSTAPCINDNECTLSVSVASSKYA